MTENKPLDMGHGPSDSQVREGDGCCCFVKRWRVFWKGGLVSAKDLRQDLTKNRKCDLSLGGGQES
jgi:hypothetical protein